MIPQDNGRRVASLKCRLISRYGAAPSSHRHVSPKFGVKLVRGMTSGINRDICQGHTSRLIDLFQPVN
jgi:hypothetical protein